MNDAKNVAQHEVSAEAKQIGAWSATANDAKNVAQHEACAEANATEKNAKTHAVNVATNVAKSESVAANAPVNENVYVEASCFDGS